MSGILLEKCYTESFRRNWWWMIPATFLFWGFIPIIVISAFIMGTILSIWHMKIDFGG